MKLFTLDEARALLPRVRAQMETLRELKLAFDQHAAALVLLARQAAADGDHLHDARDRHERALHDLYADLEATIAAVLALGVEVKGIEEGLVDFPSERDGRIVYLCWKLDEPDITHWHELDTGFAGRRPL